MRGDLASVGEERLERDRRAAGEVRRVDREGDLDLPRGVRAGKRLFGLCDDIPHAVIDEEKMVSLRRYHTITESKNGAGAVPIRTDRGWIHIAHGVRNTAAGLRYVLYAFATALDDPSRVIAEPSGMLLGPLGHERVGDVSNVVFTNGCIVDPAGKVYIYYASSDTRLHVCTTDLARLTDYVFHTPADPGRSADCVKQRVDFINRNLQYLKK